MALDLNVYVGNKEVSKDDTQMTTTPKQRGRRHVALSYSDYHDMIISALSAHNLSLTQTVHALRSGGGLYFGMGQIDDGTLDYPPLLCWQASDNQRVASCLYIGVGIPENNTVVMTTDITLGPVTTERISHAIGYLPRSIKFQNDLFALFKQTRLVGVDAECGVIEMLRKGIISSSKVGYVISEWDTPDEHSDTVWRMFNAVARSYKPTGHSADSISALTNRSPALMRYCMDLVMERLRVE